VEINEAFDSYGGVNVKGFISTFYSIAIRTLSCSSLELNIDVLTKQD